MTCSERLLDTTEYKPSQWILCACIHFHVCRIWVEFLPSSGLWWFRSVANKKCARRPLCWEQRQVLPPPLGQFPAGNSPYLSQAHIVRCPHGTLYIRLTPFQTFCSKDKPFLKRVKFHNETDTCTSTNLYHVEHNREAFASVRERHSSAISYCLSVFSKACIQYDFYFRFFIFHS